MKNKNSKSLFFCFITAVILSIFFSICFASEEDYAIVVKTEITAKTTSETFSTVIVITKQSDNGIGLEYLQVICQGKKFNVPQKELSKIKHIDLSTLKISSEAGYPDKNLGPFLYVTIQSSDWKTKYRVIFTEKGYKEILK